MLRNPFYVYIATFGTALAIYQLGWSDIYPPMSNDTFVFFGSTFLAAALLGTFIAPAINATHHYQPGLLPKYSWLFVVGSFLAELALSGGVPILLVIRGASFYVLEANATHLHLFVFWSVYSTIRFADYLYSGRRLYLLEASLPIIFYILFIYRGPAIICLVSWVFVFIIKHRGVRLRHFAVLSVVGAIVMLLNGLLGDARSPGQESAAVPSAAFRASGIPQTYFWSYLYATLPIANLQLSVDRINKPQGSTEEFLASELLPDTISKRVLPILNPRIRSSGYLATRDLLYSWEQPQVSPGLNIATIYGRSYGFFGWIGAAIMFVALATFIIVYLILILKSPYRVVCLALLNTLVVFCLLNNMIASAATLPLLILPLLLPPWRSVERTSAVVTGAL
jgi:hypothetical protein